MNKTYKYTLSSGEKKEITLDVGVNRLAISNANGEDGVAKIEKLKDVELTDLANGQILVYDSTDEKWKNENQREYTAGDGIKIDNDVITMSDESYQAVSGLSYSLLPQKTGTKWIDNNDRYKVTIPIQSPLSLPNNGTLELTIPVNGIDKVVNYETFFTNGTDFLAIVNNENVAVKATETKVIITTNADYSSYTGYVTIYYTLKKAFDKVLFTTDYSDTADSSQYQLYGNNGYNIRIWLDNVNYNVYIGLYRDTYGIQAVALCENSVTINNRYRRLGGGSQQGLRTQTLSNAYSDKGYYIQIANAGDNFAFNGNRMGIQTVFNSLNELLTAYFD